MLNIQSFILNISGKVVNFSASVVIAAAMTILPSQIAVAGGDNEINFALTDNPGRWFDTLPIIKELAAISRKLKNKLNNHLKKMIKNKDLKRDTL